MGLLVTHFPWSEAGTSKCTMSLGAYALKFFKPAEK